MVVIVSIAIADHLLFLISNIYVDADFIIE